jgi:hypothetical protein
LQRHQSHAPKRHAPAHLIFTIKDSRRRRGDQANGRSDRSREQRLADKQTAQRDEPGEQHEHEEVASARRFESLQRNQPDDETHAGLQADKPTARHHHAANSQATNDQLRGR